MEPRLVKCFFYRLYIPQILQISIEQRKANEEYTTNKQKSLNQSTINQQLINQNINPSLVPSQNFKQKTWKDQRKHSEGEQNGRMNKKSLSEGKQTSSCN